MYSNKHTSISRYFHNLLLAYLIRLSSCAKRFSPGVVVWIISAGHALSQLESFYCAATVTFFIFRDKYCLPRSDRVAGRCRSLPMSSPGEAALWKVRLYTGVSAAFQMVIPLPGFSCRGSAGQCSARKCHHTCPGHACLY
ncbi:hypothetical protein DYBT9623_05551 [Dyadobacter sp. CECT 9623]|uniref:Uncharacterized protein n=1 Tax=Dyadobacter linearis TaxID=2823330 RepID=A0ABM8UYZ9_9BACT|nr:hypothetical protein DYBT9623_05551 [Dyadobacter sp. CECT 9623]